MAKSPTLLVLALLAIPASGQQQRLPGRYFTPDTLVAQLNNPATKNVAQSYLTGVYDLTQQSGQSCALRGTTTPILLEQVFSNYLTAHPDLMHADRTAASVAAQAFAENWPCQTIAASTPEQPKVLAQDQTDKLSAILSSINREPCKNIGSVVSTLTSDPQASAQAAQLPAVKGFIANGVTLEEYLRATLALLCMNYEQKQYKLPQFTLNIQKSPVINASANLERKTVTLTTGIIDFTRDDPGELAFVMGHEFGHLADQPNGCNAALQKAGLPVSLFQVANQRMCEKRADNLGFQYLVGAGFNPYAAAAFFGRLQMFQGRDKENLLFQFLSDHPIDPERIQSLRNLYIKLSQDQSGLPTVR